MPKPQIDWNAIRVMAFSSGLSLREIARQLHIPPGSLFARASREGWGVSKTFGPTGSTKIPLATKKQLRDSAALSAQAAVDSFHNKSFRSRLASAVIIEKIVQHLQALEPEQLLDRYKQIESVVRSADKTFAWSDPISNRSDGVLKPDLFSLTPEQLSALARAEEENLRLQHAKTANARLVESPSDPEPDLPID